MTSQKTKARPKRIPKPKVKRQGQNIAREIKAETPRPRFWDLVEVKGG